MIPVTPFVELSSQVKIKEDLVCEPSFGRYLQDFVVGQTVQHPRGFTFHASFAVDFALTFHETNPLYLNQDYAKALGFKDTPVSPMLVFNSVLSQGVQADSEKAFANLGYYQVHFLTTVYPGDTLFSETTIKTVEDKGPEKPGIVTLQTCGFNQRGEAVLQYERKIMVKQSPYAASVAPNLGSLKKPWSLKNERKFAELNSLKIHHPAYFLNTPTLPLTTQRTFFNEFEVGQIILHPNGRTITDEHLAWTNRVLNTHPLHYDKIYSHQQSGAMSGEPIVYGGLVFAWLHGLASRDVSENSVWDLGCHEGYHTQPTFSGDTVFAISRCIDKHLDPQLPGLGVVQWQLIGIKNSTPRELFKKYGADLFIKENSKSKLGKEKIAEKVFEIERRFLVRV